MTSGDRHDWVIVLAGGEGSRLRALTTDADGRVRPKQFCSLHGEKSLLQVTLARAERIAPSERIVVIVAAQHESWWRTQLDDVLPENVIVQPQNRGTAPGVLLPLLHVLAHDAASRVTVLPSDHYVREEDVLASSLRHALESIHSQPDGLIVLGITPDAPETEYGWIVPASAATRDPVPVGAFVEKPSPSIAQQMFRGGGLWSSFVLVTRGDALLARFQRRMPRWVGALRNVDPRATATLEQPYADLDSRDFSREILQNDGVALRVLCVPACGWTDLGTPRRVIECLGRIGLRELAPRMPSAAARRADQVHELRAAVLRKQPAGTAV
jgi:mannose-1-phosphate guanylyltransferase